MMKLSTQAVVNKVLLPQTDLPLSTHQCDNAVAHGWLHYRLYHAQKR